MMMSKEGREIPYTLTAAPVKYGFMNILKNAQPYFPETEESIRVSVYLDDKTEAEELTYSGKKKMLYGLTGWLREHRAVPGDKIIIQPLGGKEYRLRFIKVKKEEMPIVERRLEPDILVGRPINFRGIVYAPLNEAGVILLFSKVMDDLGMIYEASPSGFPDAVVRRATSRGWEKKLLEFEFKSGHFKLHKHDPEKCDIIVCWEHDWKECPPELEVIELRNLIRKLPKEEASNL